MAKRRSRSIKPKGPPSDSAPKGARQQLLDILDKADSTTVETSLPNYNRAADEEFWDDEQAKVEIAAEADRQKAELEKRLEEEDALRLERCGLALDPVTLELKSTRELSKEVQRALELKIMGHPGTSEDAPMPQVQGQYTHGWEDSVANFVGMPSHRNDSGKLVSPNAMGFHNPEKTPTRTEYQVSPVILSYLHKNGITDAMIQAHFQGKKFNLIDANRMVKAHREAVESGVSILNKPPKIDVILDNGLPKHTVQLLRDHVVEYPELFLQVHIVGPSWEERAFMEMFARSRCHRSKTIKDADLVVFTGGADVSPELYGEEPHATTRPFRSRDEIDIKAFLECIELGVPMLGICRGAQLGHVGHGGVLYQDVDNHNGAHSIWDVNRKKTIDRTSSSHHQMCRIVDNGMELIATATESKERWLSKSQKETGKNADVEAFFYKDTCFIGLQGHPEYSGYPEYTKWSLELINELVCCNPDVEWRGSARRIKEDILAGRDYVVPKYFTDFIDPPKPVEDKKKRAPRKPKQDAT